MINFSLQLLHPIMTVTPSEPGPDSPARLAFDPQFPRVIVSYIPLHVIQLPDQAHTWALLKGLLTSLKNVNYLASTAELTTWEVYTVTALPSINIKSSIRLLVIYSCGAHSPIAGFHTSVQSHRRVTCMPTSLVEFCDNPMIVHVLGRCPRTQQVCTEACCGPVLPRNARHLL